MAIGPQEPDKTGMNGSSKSGGPEPPHAVDAERPLIGALMLNNDFFSDTENVGLLSEHFYEKRHQVAFSTMLKMQADNRHVSPVTLAHFLHGSGQLRECGGKEYLADLAAIAAAPVNVAAYAKLVRDTAMLRDLIKALTASHIRAFRPAGDPPTKILDEAEARLFAVGDKFARHVVDMRKAGPIASSQVVELGEIVSSGDYDRLSGHSTGFTDLDSKTAGGLHGGELIILAGRPGAGKTAFAINIARHIAAEGVGVCIFSLEMSAEQLTQRLLSQISQVDAQKLRTGRGLSGEELAQLAEGAEDLSRRELHIDDSGVLNILEAKARVRRFERRMQKKGKKLGLIIVDYLQLMETDPDDSRENRATQVASISRGLKALARDVNAPVMALSQLNRSVTKDSGGNRRPVLSDLRESGAIEQDADLVMFLHQEEGKAGVGDPEEIELIIGKQRNGPVGKLDLHFRKRFSRFTSPSGSWRGD